MGLCQPRVGGVGGGCANTGEVIGGAPVHGLLQTAPRALAVLCAIKWAARSGFPITSWSDALHVVQKLQLLLAGGILVDDCANHDLWLQIQTMLDCIQPGAVSVQHVHSHLDAERLTSPLEDWIKKWNDAADRAAMMANVNRGVLCKESHARALAWFQNTAQQLRFWRRLYFDIAGVTLRQRHPTVQPEAEDFEAPSSQILWIDRPDITAERVPVNWCALTVTACPHLPADFVRDLLAAFIRFDSSSLQACTVSWIEFLFLLETGGWRSAEDVPFRPYRTHVAVQLRMVRKVISTALSAAGLQDVLCEDVDVSGFGISMPMGGVILGCPQNVLNAARQKLAAFSRARKIRVMADLARPICS